MGGVLGARPPREERVAATFGALGVRPAPDATPTTDVDDDDDEQGARSDDDDEEEEEARPRCSLPAPASLFSSRLSSFSLWGRAARTAGSPSGAGHIMMMRGRWLRSSHACGTAPSSLRHPSSETSLVMMRTRHVVAGIVLLSIHDNSTHARCLRRDASGMDTSEGAAAAEERGAAAAQWLSPTQLELQARRAERAAAAAADAQTHAPPRCGGRGGVPCGGRCD
eukprot:COSAG01_NODE_9598_length_2395_cov_1.765244_1_plen_224_part_00